MNTKDYQYILKKDEFNVLKDKYIKNGTISWSTFSSDQETNQGKIVLLTNNDFATGTLRIQSPCLLKLTENISFNPNRPTTWLDQNGNVTSVFSQAKGIDPNRTQDWFPDPTLPNNSQYFEPEVMFAYSLGFFAGIAIETSDVIVDLNGYTLEQHKEHALQQRFFACIELADQPFIPFQGPSNFGLVLRPARHCMIMNGKIGRSSHHGIHGNSQADTILIENVTFSDFEVGAIALNGAKNVYINGVTVNGNNKQIPVLGTYSAGRFSKLFTKEIIRRGLNTTELNTAVNNLNIQMDITFNSHIFGSGSIPTLFKNNSGLIDGNCYGILFNPNGVAVNNFLERRINNKANECSNICLFNTSITSIHGKINEIVAIGTGSGSAQVDTAGASLQFFNGVSNLVGDKYYYQGTVLSEVQIILAKIKQNLIDNSQNSSFFGTLNITKGAQLWRDNSSYYFKLISTNQLGLYNSSNVAVQVNSQPVVHEIFMNGDSMFHVNKGVMGLRSDGVNSMYLSNCLVADIVNYGNKGVDQFGHYLHSHPSQGAQIGYNGSDTYGVILSACNDVSFKSLTVQNVNSDNGQSIGFGLQNDTCTVKGEEAIIRNITAGSDQTFVPSIYLLPNQIPTPRALFVDESVYHTKIKNLVISDIVGMTNNPYKFPTDIRSPITLE